MNIDDQVDQQAALAVPCPGRDDHGCGAPVGRLCLNLSTGEPLRNLPAHVARMRSAGIRHAPLDPSDLNRRDDRTPTGTETHHQ